MSEVITTQIDGLEVFIEVERPEGIHKTTSLKEKFEKSMEKALVSAQDTMVVLAGSFAKKVNNMPGAEKPDQFSIEFGFNFNAEGKVLIAKSSIGATFKVSMSYSKK